MTRPAMMPRRSLSWAWTELLMCFFSFLVVQRLLLLWMKCWWLYSLLYFIHNGLEQLRRWLEMIEVAGSQFRFLHLTILGVLSNFWWPKTVIKYLLHQLNLHSLLSRVLAAFPYVRSSGGRTFNPFLRRYQHNTFSKAFSDSMSSLAVVFTTVCFNFLA